MGWTVDSEGLQLDASRSGLYLMIYVQVGVVGKMVYVCEAVVQLMMCTEGCRGWFMAVEVD